MPRVRVELGSRSYDIAIGEAAGAFSPFVAAAVPQPTGAVIVVDARIEPIAAALASQLQSVLRTAIVTVPSGEGSKSLAQYSQLLDALTEFPADRKTVIIAVGGGVIGDLAGFAAATFNRGLPLVMVPTTLLAMVDSSVGGKTGINHARGKNLVGAFHQPAGVWIDPAHLQSLPPREFASGLAEVVKYGVSLDAGFLLWLQQNVTSILAKDDAALAHVIAECCRIKAGIVREDEREETGRRAILNYGHTFAHAFEVAANYSGLLHGEAVAIGMDCAARLAATLGRVDVTGVQRELLHAFGLATGVNPAWPTDALLGTMRRDKKTLGGKLRFVLPQALGVCELVDDVPEAAVREVLTS
jgi:3-dehydroquinate synthase